MMKPTSQCLTPELLHQLAHDELTATELKSIEDHLDDCESCRALLVQAEADDLWAQQIAPVLRLPATDSVFESTIDPDQLLNPVLGLLGPTDDPQMLGRIGTYEVVGIIGRGGMGLVFKSLDRALNRFVAIKMLLPHLAESAAARKRFAREGQAAAAVVDDHVMPIYSVAEWQGVPYLVMQYSRGTTLQKRVETQGPLEVKEILRIGMQTARGLAAAHAQGLVHRDVKPSNIMIDGTVERALLTDFGLARAVDDASITRTGVIAGTPQYMSPEQARAAEIDARSDLFSLGSVLYFLCTGRPPFRAESTYAVLRLIIDQEPLNMREINPDLPAWLCTLVSHLMAKNPGDRPATAQEVADLLQRCLAHLQQPTSVTLPPSLQSAVPVRSAPRRQGAGRHVVIGISSAAALLVLLAISFQLFAWRAGSKNADSKSAATSAGHQPSPPIIPEISGTWTVQGQESERVVIEHEANLPGQFTMRSLDAPHDLRWSLEWSSDRQQFEGVVDNYKEVTGPLRFSITPVADSSQLQVRFLLSDVQKQRFIHSQLAVRENVPAPDHRPFEEPAVETELQNLSHQVWIRSGSATDRSEEASQPPSKVTRQPVQSSSDEESVYHKFDSGAIAAGALNTWRDYVEWWNVTQGTPMLPTGEIPRAVWSAPLKKLNPKYIYANGVNLVIVRQDDEEGEEGIYVALGISSSHGPDDSQFSRILIAHASGGDVYTFRRKGHLQSRLPVEQPGNHQ